MYDYREQGGYTEWEELDKTSLIVEQSWHCRANQQWPPWSKINCRERVYAAPACFQPGTNATFLYCTFIRVLGTVSRGVLWNLPARLLPVWNTYVSMIINKYIREHLLVCVSMCVCARTRVHVCVCLDDTRNDTNRRLSTIINRSSNVWGKSLVREKKREKSLDFHAISPGERNCFYCVQTKDGTAILFGTAEQKRKNKLGKETRGRMKSIGHGSSD